MMSKEKMHILEEILTSKGSYYKRSINRQNALGDAPLHLACRRGTNLNLKQEW